MELFTDLGAIMKVLNSRVGSTERYRGFLRVVPRDSPFEEIHVASRPLGIGFEKKYLFVGRLTVVPRDSMDERGREMYRVLKGLECELEKRGTLRRRPVFVPRKRLARLRGRLPGLTISSTLAERLNGDSELMETLKRLDPLEVTVGLKSIGDFPNVSLKEGQDPLEAIEAAFYEDPEEIVWEPLIAVMLTRIPGFRKRVLEVVRALDLIGRDVIQVVGLIARK